MYIMKDQEKKLIVFWNTKERINARNIQRKGTFWFCNSVMSHK